MSECKKCPSCKQLKLNFDFFKKELDCKKCMRKKFVARRRKATAKNIAAKEKGYQKAYQKANLEKFRLYSKNVVTNLSNSYVAHLLGFPVANLSPELLALKRQQVETHHLSKQIAKALKAKGNPA